MGVKVNSATQSDTIKRKDFLVSNTNEGYGTTAITDFFSALEPIDGKRTLYIKTGIPTNPLSIYVAEDEETLLNIIGKYSPVTTELEAISYINDSPDMFITSMTVRTDNMKKPKLVLDARDTNSYYGNGSTWYDLSGESLTGNISGAYYDSRQASFEFFGTSQSVTISNSAPLQITGDLTIEMLIRPNNISSKKSILYKSTTGEYTVNLDNTGNLEFIWAGASIQIVTTTGQPLSEMSKWYHITLVRDLSSATKTIKWYINGDLNVSTTANHSVATSTTNPVIIGSGNQDDFSGGISIVRLMNQALTEVEVKENYHQAGILTDNLLLSIDPTNHVSYARSGTSSFSKVNGYEGVLNGVISTPNNANYWEFYGNDSYIQTNDNLLGTVSGSYSIEGWFYLKDTTNVGYGLNSLPLISHNPTQSGFGLKVQTQNDLNYFHFGSGGTNGITANTYPIRLGTWYHVVGVNDGVNDYLYVNSVERITASSSTITSSVSPLQIGQLNGRIGLVNIYDRGLTQKEVFKNYNANIDRFDTSHVVKDMNLLIDLDASNIYSYPGSGNIWYDISGNELDSTIIGNPSYKSNKFILTGTQYFELDPSIGDTLNGLESASVELVIKRDSAVSGASDAGLIQLSGLDSTDGTLYPWTDDSIYLDILRSNRVIGTSSVTSNFRLQEFTTLTVVKNSVDYRVYINGILVNTLANDTTSVVVNNIIQGGLTLGRNSSTKYFVGDIHALRIYTSDLSEFEVSRHHEINIKNFLLSDYGQISKVNQIASAIAASGGTLLSKDCLTESVKYTWNMDLGIDLEAFAKTFEIKLASEALGGTILDTLFLYNSIKNN